MIAFFRLVRFPAVFTVLADLSMGFLLADGNTEIYQANWTLFGVLCISSICFYWAGMALNDLVDLKRDRENPDRCCRPLPAGKISVQNAKIVIAILFSVGIIAGGIACVESVNPKLSVIALIGLATAIILYDCVFKFYWIAPLLMGLCRALNILFALSLNLTGTIGQNPAYLWVLAAFCVYITGVTWFARLENEPGEGDFQLGDLDNSRSSLLIRLIPVALIAGGVLLLIPLLDSGTSPEKLLRWRLLVGVLALMVGSRALQAVLNGNPAVIGPVVGYCLLTLIVLDAAVVFQIHGAYPSICIIGLLIPAILFNRLTYIT